MRVFDEAVQLHFERPALLERQIVQEPVGAGVDNQDLLFDRQRRILALLQNLHHAAAARELRRGGFVQIRAELREGGQRAILRQIQTQAAGHLPHGLDLRVAADAAHRDTDVDRGPHVGVEQVRFEINLAVGDRNHVGRNVGRNVAGLGFDERQRGERSAAQFVR